MSLPTRQVCNSEITGEFKGDLSSEMLMLSKISSQSGVLEQPDVFWQLLMSSAGFVIYNPSWNDFKIYILYVF